MTLVDVQVQKFRGPFRKPSGTSNIMKKEEEKEHRHKLLILHIIHLMVQVFHSTYSTDVSCPRTVQSALIPTSAADQAIPIHSHNKNWPICIAHMWPATETTAR
jgi:hypothetical protein